MKISEAFKELLSGGGLSLEMVGIPAGVFLMGSPDGEPDSCEDEKPQHEVSVPAFFMGKFPVAQAQYEAIMGENPTIEYNPCRFVASDKPVVGVSWHDAMEFCARLSQQTGRKYRLPTEAEWEYACRAGTTTPFHFGETITTDIANYDGNYAYSEGLEGEYRQATTPVGYFGVFNGFDLSDMHGNVWEWCLDHWNDSYEGAPADGSAWLTECENENFVLRGGSLSDAPGSCRSAYRNHYHPDYRRYDIGFRVVCNPNKEVLCSQ